MHSRVRRSFIPRARGASTLIAILGALALLGPPSNAASPAHGLADNEIPLADKTIQLRSTSVGDDLYQAGWSRRHHALWVTTTAHRDTPGTRIPERSAILKISPHTGEVLDMIEPRVLDAGTEDERVEAAYGIAIDDEHDRIWTSSTHEEAVVVHNQSTGAHLATIGGLGHARDIVIDRRHDTAYVSDPINGVITSVDTRTLEITGEVVEETSDFSPMSLDLVEGKGGRTFLYTVNLNDGALVEYDVARERTRVVAQTGGKRASGIAVDRHRQRAYIASQASADLRTVDLTTGRVIAVVPASGAALNTDVDSRAGLVTTALFTSNAVLVTDADTGAKVAEVELADRPHDVLVADGSTWVLDQAVGGSSLWEVGTVRCR